MNTKINTVRDLLNAEGCGPWMSYPAYTAAVELAEVVAGTIQRPALRVAFAANAALDLTENDPSVLAPHAACIAALTEQAECQRSTPLGSTEIWGNLLQRLEGAE